VKVLVVGSGGREHALCAALRRSASVERVFCAPGSDGIAQLATVAPEIQANNTDGLIAYAKSLGVGLVVVGPEAPLVAGLADAVRKAGIPCFGPGADGAQLEGSKTFAKQLMVRNNVPTAGYKTFVSLEDARAHVLGLDAFPVVVKADGLAAGKGVTVCATRDAALAAVSEAMEQKKFGDAGTRVVVEEFLRGEEVSVHAITDGTTLLVLPSAQDHKRVRDGDQGPNTGGMGAYSPAPVLTEKLLDVVVRTILVPTLHGLKIEGIEFRGVLYAGLMVTRSGPKVLEFNARFGDPETQVILPRIRSDLGAILLAAAEGRLTEIEEIDVDPRPVVGVVMASEGYPEAFKTGKPITGIEAAAAMPDVTVHHAATRRKDGAMITAGGRVLTVCGAGATHAEARDRAYQAVRAISWEGEHHRGDIARRAIEGLPAAK
jgi:phosphoribosylamine--glycine ligase